MHVKLGSVIDISRVHTYSLIQLRPPRALVKKRPTLDFLPQAFTRQDGLHLTSSLEAGVALAAGAGVAHIWGWLKKTGSVFQEWSSINAEKKNEKCREISSSLLNRTIAKYV